MSNNESPITSEHGLVFTELADGDDARGNVAEPPRVERDGNLRDLGLMDWTLGDLDVDGSPVPDDDQGGRLAPLPGGDA